jgi:hypothetical protein
VNVNDKQVTSHKLTSDYQKYPSQGLLIFEIRFLSGDFRLKDNVQSAFAMQYFNTQTNVRNKI